MHENNDHDQWVVFNRAMGSQMSAMEHLAPEGMFSTEEAPAHGISAVRAIQLAAMEGQRIWTITRDNLNEALAASQLPGKAKTDIRNSVLAGMEVTAHEKPVNFFGRESTGYIVLNPETGAGAYLIGSGENGGEIDVGDATDVVSWLLSLLDMVGDNPLLKGLASRLGFIIDVFGVVKDYMECGAVYALMKYYVTQIVIIGVAFLILPYVAVFLSLYLALMISFLAALAISLVFSSAFSCRRD